MIITFKRLLLLVVVMSVVSACSVRFLPTYKATALDRLASAFDNVAYIAACVDLGTCAKPSDFGLVSDRYISAIAELDTVLGLVAAPEDTETTRRQAEANLRRQVENCRTQVLALSAEHQRETLAKSSLPLTTRSTCQIMLQSFRSL